MVVGAWQQYQYIDRLSRESGGMRHVTRMILYCVPGTNEFVYTQRDCWTLRVFIIAPLLPTAVSGSYNMNDMYPVPEVGQSSRQNQFPDFYTLSYQIIIQNCATYYMYIKAAPGVKRRNNFFFFVNRRSNRKQTRENSLFSIFTICKNCFFLAKRKKNGFLSTTYIFRYICTDSSTRSGVSGFLFCFTTLPPLKKPRCIYLCICSFVYWL